MSPGSRYFADHLIGTSTKNTLQDLPGPFAPPFKMRPSRNMMARSYSFTICNKQVDVTPRVSRSHVVVPNYEYTSLRWS